MPASSVNPARALAALGIRGEVVKLLEQQRNMTWEVRTSAGTRIVLRRYRDDREMDEVAYELDVVRRLDTLGWPVPVPIESAREIDGAVWCASRFLEGAPLERTPEDQRKLGRVIARLQSDLGTLGITHQRVGWTRADEILSASPAPSETFRACASRLPDETKVLLEFSERAEEQLDDLQSAAYPSVLVHGDLTTWNVHFIEGELTGLFDFEMVHMDLAVTEFANTWRGRYEGFIEGFEEISPLTDQERALIAPVRWAWLIDVARRALLKADDAELGWTMQQLARRSPLMRF